jgi:hypothetical protein
MDAKQLHVLRECLQVIRLDLRSRRHGLGSRYDLGSQGRASMRALRRRFSAVMSAIPPCVRVWFAGLRVGLQTLLAAAPTFPVLAGVASPVAVGPDEAHELTAVAVTPHHLEALRLAARVALSAVCVP